MGGGEKDEKRRTLAAALEEGEEVEVFFQAIDSARASREQRPGGLLHGSLARFRGEREIEEVFQLR